MTQRNENHGRDQINIGEIYGNPTINQTQVTVVDEIKTRPFKPTSPYLGLKPFTDVDKDYFFGRNQFLIDLEKELEQTNIILLLGASGSGKSSVVRAGLLPSLTQKWGSRLIDLILTPDRDPFEALYLSLGNYYRQSEAQIARVGNVDTLSQVVQTLKQPESFWLIFIDQFEELFTTSQPEKRDRFIQSLVQLSQARSPDPSLKIVATMRSDFLDRLDLDPANRLAKITDGHRPLMTQMHQDELRLAIEQPAARHGVVFEAGLVEMIIQDVQGQAGYLPLLQYTLNRLWEEELQTSDLQQERTLRTTTYLQLGGVKGALQQHVDAIYQRLQQEGNHLVTQRIFLKLVEIGGDAESGTDWKPVRRRANCSEFKDEQEKAVLAQLIDETLIVSDRDFPAQAQESTVEIAHEILLTSWTTLNIWIKENRRAIALRNRLNDDVARWQANKTDDELWTGSKLEQVLELKNSPTFNQVLGGFSTTANQFIDASQGKRDRHVQAEIQHQRQQKTLYRRIATGAIAALAIVTGMTAFATTKWRDADLGHLQALLQSSEANFQLNRGSLDALIDSLRAGHQLQRSPWLRNDTQLRQQVMQTLGQSLYRARESNRLEGHDGYILGLSFSPDGQTIATASYDKTIRLWSLNGKQEKVLKPLDQPLTSVSISPDGKIIAAASYEGIVSLLNLEGKPLVPSLKGHAGPIWKVAFSPNGQTLATAGDDGTLRFWKTTGQPLSSRTLTAKGTKFDSVAFSTDGAKVAAGRSDGNVLVLDNQGKLIRTLTGHTAPVYGIAFSPDGHIIATASDDKRVILWDSSTGAIQSTLIGHTAEVRDVAFSPDGETIATAGFDDTVKQWNRKGELLDTLRGHTGQVFAVKFHPKSNLVVSASNDKTIRLWQVNPWLKSLAGHSGKIFSVRFNPVGDRIASGDFDGVVRLWNVQGKLLKNLPIRHGPVTDVDFSRDRGMLAVANADGTVTLLDQQGNPLSTLPMHQKPTLSVSFSPDSQLLATTGVDKTLKLWNRKTQKITTFLTHTALLYNSSWSPDGKMFGVTADDGIVQLFTPNGKLLTTLKSNHGQAYKVTFSPDSKVIATSGNDKTIKLWHLDGRLLKTLEGHQAAVWDIRFSPDGRWLASASDDETIKLWSRDGQLLTTLKGHTGQINSISFSADGKLLASGSADKTVMIWDVANLSLENWLGRGCDWMRDYLQTNAQAPRDICTR